MPQDEGSSVRKAEHRHDAAVSGRLRCAAISPGDVEIGQVIGVGDKKSMSAKPVAVGQDGAAGTQQCVFVDHVDPRAPARCRDMRANLIGQPVGVEEARARCRRRTRGRASSPAAGGAWTGTRHFGVVSVIGRNRLPIPAASSSARMRPSFLAEAGFVDLGDQLGCAERQVADARRPAEPQPAEEPR